MSEILKSNERLQKALVALAGGAEATPINFSISGKKGRPRTRYRIDDVILSKDEYEAALKINTESAVARVERKSMTEGDFSELCRLAVPELMDRAIRLAMISEDPKEVMAVAKEIVDRGYGKVTKVHDTDADPSSALQRGWQSFGASHGIPKVIDAEVVDED